jgi:TRAP-type C4-dicarboxylate transport system permease small subunit
MKWIDTAADLLNRMAAGILFAMMLLAMTDVVLRKVFSQGVLGALELTEFMMAGVVFFALARTERLDRNVQVDLVMQRFSRRTQLFTAMLTGTFSCLLCLSIAAAMFVYAHAMRTSGEVSMDLWIPKYPFIYVVAAGCALLALILLMKVLAAFREIRSSWNL